MNTAENNVAPLVNEYLKIRCIIEDHQTMLEKLREQILATGMDRLEGTYSAIEVRLSERKSYDETMMKAFLNAAQLEVCSKLDVTIAKKFIPEDKLKECVTKTSIIESLCVVDKKQPVV